MTTKRRNSENADSEDEVSNSNSDIEIEEESEGTNSSEEEKESDAQVENESEGNNSSDEEENEINESDAQEETVSDEEEKSGTDDDKSKNPAWADSVSKILNSKPKTNKPLVLSKAKKLTEVKIKPKPAGFEVQLNDGNVKEEVIEPVVPKLEESRPKKRRRKEIPDLRVKPNILQKDRERILAKIATKGVVQLFNAVRSQQKDIKDKLDQAGPLEVKKDKVLKNLDKNTFLDVLMGEKSQNVEEVLKKRKPAKVPAKVEKEDKIWDVLRDNYMMNAKMKDWDKELEEELEIEME